MGAPESVPYYFVARAEQLGPAHHHISYTNTISYTVLYTTFPHQLHFLFCTLRTHGYSVTIYLYFLIPSHLHPVPYMPLPSSNHQNALHIHDSVSVLLVCLLCFLDSIIDIDVFIAILLFIVLIFFYLHSPFSISYNNGLVIMKSFSFFLTGKVFICPLILNDIFAG